MPRKRKDLCSPFHLDQSNRELLQVRHQLMAQVLGADEYNDFNAFSASWSPMPWTPSKLQNLRLPNSMPSYNAVTWYDEGRREGHQKGAKAQVTTSSANSWSTSAATPRNSPTSAITPQERRTSTSATKARATCATAKACPGNDGRTRHPHPRLLPPRSQTPRP
jgi:hypothetical protein